MKTRLLFIFLIVSMIGRSQSSFHWPNGKKAAIILTYDDALTSQLNIALPQLDSFHLQGTFFLIGYRPPAELDRWASASRKGHELANHTLYHPCAMLTPVPEYSYYTVGRLIREINVTNDLLYFLDHRTPLSYAYPCTETRVQGIDYSDSLAGRTSIKFARGGGDSTSIITQFQTLNPYIVPSWGVAANTDGSVLINYVQRVIDQGGMGVFMFHGIGGDYITVSADAHRALLQFLATHKKEIWVTTFREAMQYIMKSRQ